MTVNENVQLKRRNTAQVSIEVFDKETGENIEEANVLIKKDETLIEGKTSGFTGSLNIEAFIGENQIISGKLGYKTNVTNLTIEKSTNTIRLELEKGIEDDFNFIYGWSIQTTAPTGSWHRGVPQGTFFQNLKSNPDTDSPDDIGDKAFVTGPPVDDVAAQDVDDGFTMLISPVFDISEIDNPVMEYSLWFFNGAGAGSIPNDYMEVMISDGSDTTLVERLVDQESQSGRWRDLSRIDISEYYKDATTLQVFVKIEDISPGHLVEGGFDNFAIVSGTSTSIEEDIDDTDITIAPNRFGDLIIIKSNVKIENLNIYDITGRLVLNKREISESEYRINTSSLIPATYIAEVFTEEKKRYTFKLVKTH